jgi:putative ABC transport system permease protein
MKQIHRLKLLIGLIINYSCLLARILVYISGHILLKTVNSMFSNYFKVAFRIFFRNRAYTLINVFGLAIGLTFSIVIFLYAHKEISYDRFHENAKRIYRVAIKGKVADNNFNHAVTPAPLAKILAYEIPEIESSIRVARLGAWLVRQGNIRYNEDNIIFTDPAFFQFFSFPLLKGSPAEVLKNPGSIVLSQQSAERYFGQENPVGKRLRIENDSTYYTVTGVMENIPDNTHMHFDMVGTLSTFDKHLRNDRWVVNYLYTYFLAKEGTSVERIKPGFEKIVSKYVIPDYRKLLNINDNRQTLDEGEYFTLIAQPLTSIHLRSSFSAEFEPVGNILYIYLFIALAIVILILACLNFINLATAQSSNRAIEVGIRKIAGSGQRKLVRQFLFESSLLAFLAMALALFFTELTLPAFSRYIGLRLSVGQLLNAPGILLLVTLILTIGIISGLYPALEFSAYNPTKVMHNQINPGSGRGYFRLVLALFQIFIAVGIISLALIIFSQFNYLVAKERGYNTHNLLIIRRPDGLGNKLEEFKSQISRQPGVVSVTNSTGIPGGSFTRLPYYPEGNSAANNYSAANLMVSYGFDSTYRITISEGRFFKISVPSDSSACVINETAVKMMGIENPIGKKIIQITDKPNKRLEFQIIGVVKDFHFETLENPINSLVMVLMPGNFEGYLTVRLAPDQQEKTIQYLKTTWEEFTAAYPFVYYLLDSDIQNNYQPVKETGRVFALLSIVAVIMACVGLFALISFHYSCRKREISIQKAMGAANKTLIFKKMVEIMKMILYSSILAWIGSWFIINSWFNDYAYHIKLNPFYFLFATAIVIVVALFTVYYHAWLVTRINPGSLLKSE